MPEPQIIEAAHIDNLEHVQNRLSAALIKGAQGLNMAKGDWVQGGWSRSAATFSDKLNYGLAKATIPGG